MEPPRIEVAINAFKWLIPYSISLACNWQIPALSFERVLSKASIWLDFILLHTIRRCLKTIFESFYTWNGKWNLWLAMIVRCTCFNLVSYNYTHKYTRSAIDYELKKLCYVLKEVLKLKGVEINTSCNNFSMVHQCYLHIIRNINYIITIYSVSICILQYCSLKGLRRSLSVMNINVRCFEDILNLFCNCYRFTY